MPRPAVDALVGDGWPSGWPSCPRAVVLMAPKMDQLREISAADAQTGCASAAGGRVECVFHRIPKTCPKAMYYI